MLWVGYDGQESVEIVGDGKGAFVGQKWVGLTGDGRDQLGVVQVYTEGIGACSSTNISAWVMQETRWVFGEENRGLARMNLVRCLSTQHWLSITSGDTRVEKVLTSEE